MPSIDINSVVETAPTPTQRGHKKQGSTGSNETEATRKSIARKSSKLSFGKRSKEREGKDKELPSRPSGGTILSMTPSSTASSVLHVSSHASITEGGRSDVLEPSFQGPEDTASLPRSPSPAASKILPPIPQEQIPASPHTPLPFPTGEVDQTVFESIGQSSLAVRFEINIVKVRTPCMLMLEAHNSPTSGPHAPLPRHPVPAFERRRLAIPYVSTAGVDRAEAMTTVAKMFLPIRLFHW